MGIGLVREEVERAHRLGQLGRAQYLLCAHGLREPAWSPSPNHQNQRGRKMRPKPLRSYARSFFWAVDIGSTGQHRSPTE